MVYWIARLCLPAEFIIHCDIGGITPIHAVVPVWLGEPSLICKHKLNDQCCDEPMHLLLKVLHTVDVSSQLGLVAGIGIGHVTEHYTSYRRKPVKEIADAFRIGTPTG
eukprot:3984839-Amphidinium_carterae.1